MPRKPDTESRDCILEVAANLFYEQGVRAVGMQQIIDEIGCGKNLLYREFPSKDDLIVAWLERSIDEWRIKFDAVIAAYPGDAAAQLVAVVRATADEVSMPEFRGCSLRNTHAEFPDSEHPAHQVAVEFVNELRARLRTLAKRAGAPDPRTLADRILLILDGLLVNGAVLGNRGAARAAVAFAEEAVRNALEPARV
jgi:AcrR family transcriptional regulator